MTSSMDGGAPSFVVDEADLLAAQRLFLLEYDAAHLAHVPEAMQRHLTGIQALRERRFQNDVAPASTFRAWTSDAAHPDDPTVAARIADRAAVDTPAGTTASSRASRRHPNLEGLGEERFAFASIDDIAAALRSGETTARRLTEMFLGRIDRHDGTLHAVITRMDAVALQQADAADRERAEGVDRGPLHGVPYLAKDLLAHPAAKTTWGAAPYRDQTIARTATALARLEAAGAVLLGKASLGALAMGDVWFGATTANPWNLEEGSSGSSAGSAAAVAAGLCAFAIGSETMGSILSPCQRCSVHGLRPTFGRISRHGAMALSWSLDKLGPIVRTPWDAGTVLAAMNGHDAKDPATVDAPLVWPPRVPDRPLRIGVPRDVWQAPDDAVRLAIERLGRRGIEPVPCDLPALPTDPIMTLLVVEAATAFEELFRGEGADAMVRQTPDAWPTLLRTARFVSGTDYLQAQRLQTVVRASMDAFFGDVDVLLAPGVHWPSMALGNAAGTPAASVALGRNEATSRPVGNVSLMSRAAFDHWPLVVADLLASDDGPAPVPRGFEPA